MDVWLSKAGALIQRPGFLLELLLIGIVLLGASMLARSFHRQTSTELINGATPGGTAQLAFPLTAILLLTVLGFIAHHVGWRLYVIAFAIQLLVALAAIRMALFALRRAFPDSLWVAGFGRSLSMVIWLGVALDALGLLSEVIDWLDGFSFHVGKTHITLWTVVQGAGSVFGTVIIALWLGGLLEARLQKAETLDTSLKIVFSRISKSLLVLVAILVGMSLVGIDLTTLSVFGGAVGVGLGFGMQKIASNYVSGFIILLDRSISIGNIIQVGQDKGEVKRITTRYTVLRAGNGSHILLPNETLVTSTVQNDSYADPRWRLAITVQVAYSSDIERALAIMEELAAADERILRDPGFKANVVALEDSGIKLELGFWVGSSAHTSPDLRSDLYRGVLRRFAEEAIEIPYPQRVIKMSNATEA